MPYDRTALLELIQSEALQRGEFTLASGKQASYYLDCRNITLHPQGANLIAAAMLDQITSAGDLPHAVGGMAIGADPITGADHHLGRTATAAPQRIHGSQRSQRARHRQAGRGTRPTGTTSYDCRGCDYQWR